jgi:pyruvate carboxylase subunit B
VKYFVRVDGSEIELSIDGDEVQVDGFAVHARLSDVEGTPVRMLTVGDEVHRVVVRPGATRGRYTLWVDGFRHEVEALDERMHAIRELAAATTGPTGPEPLVAPMPGMIVRVLVQPGDVVQPGQGLVVMEAMKMENELRAATPASVRAVRAQPGSAVEKGALLIELEEPG